MIAEEEKDPKVPDTKDDAKPKPDRPKPEPPAKSKDEPKALDIKAISHDKKVTIIDCVRQASACPNVG